MKSRIRYVGMDVHKNTIAVAVAEEGDGNPMTSGEIPNLWVSLERKLKRLGQPESIQCCYEAGPCGFELYRRLRSAGIECMVAAPSLVPKRAGDRMQTDRRDARKLARYLRSGDLTAVYVPDEVSEAMRDLVRARADAKKALHTARRQLLHLILRQGRRYGGKSHWTQAHMDWIQAQRFDYPAQQFVLADYIRTVESAKERVGRFDDDLVSLLPSWDLYPLVQSLQPLRGISLLLAAIIVAELGDLRRFEHPSQLMSYVGLVPSEGSSGEKQRRGGITHTGNAHARFAIVEAAWAYRFPPRRGYDLRKRSESLPEAIQEVAWKAQQRLYRKYLKLRGRGKDIQKVMTAVGRELLGFIWAIGQQVKLKARSA